MSFRAKALVVFCLFGAGAALIWLRHPSPNALAPATSPQRGQDSEGKNKLVPQAAGTGAASKDDFGFVVNSAKKGARRRWQSGTTDCRGARKMLADKDPIPRQAGSASGV